MSNHSIVLPHENTPRCHAARFSRREMLGQVITGLASGWICASYSLADDKSLPEKNRSGFCTLGFSTYGMQKMETEQALKHLAEIGYDAIELAVRTDWDADSARLSVSRRTALRDQIRKSGLQLSSLMEHVTPTDKKNQAFALERLKLAGEVAHDLVPDHPPLIQTILGGGTWVQVKEQLRDYLGAWAELADQLNVTIAIKPHRGGAVSKPSEAIWLMEQLGNPKKLKMVYDYSHYAFRDLPLADTVEISLPFTAHVVVKDAVEENGKVVFKLPGDAGTIDYASILKLFYAGGYRGDFNCEVSGMVSGRPGYDPIAAAKTSYANIAKEFQRAEVPRPAR